METPKHPLTIQQSRFLSKVRSVLPEKLYFYGSILRDDFLPGISDIDVLYFTKDNLQKTVDDLYRFLLQDTNKTRLQQLQFLYHSTETRKVISGYKIKYTSIDSGMVIEISFYEFPFKEMIMKEQLRKADIPVFVVYSMLILKVLAYKYRVLPENLFRWIKDRLFINMSGIKNTFLPVDNK
jgi:predicted nucleotidyltransferase